MKRLLSLFLCLAMLLTLFPTLVLAEDGKLTPVATRLQTVAEDGNTYVYCVYEGEAGDEAPYFAALEYVGHGEFTVTDLVIPATVPYEGQQVPLRYVGLPETSTFNYGPLYNLSGDVKDTVRTVEIPATVEEISKQAFQSFTSLTAVTFHEGLKSIGYCAFFGATSLTELTLPSSLETIGVGAFKNCSDLVSVNFQDLTALKEISREAFHSSGVREADFAEGLTIVGCQAFCGSRLQTVSFPATLETLEGECFKDCKSLETITFPDEMNENFTLLTGFNNCSALKELRIPNTVQTVAASAFESSGLTAVTVPASVALIENKAFWMSKDLADLVILPGTTPLTIGPLAFYSCTALSDGVIRLPKRVTELQEGCFSSLWLIATEDKPSRSPTFYIYNDRIHINCIRVTERQPIEDGASPQKKTCPKCQRTLPMSDFYVMTDRPDGHSSYCKECNRQHGRLRNGTTGEYRPDPTLSAATDKQLYEELKRRGYEGKLTKTLALE